MKNKLKYASECLVGGMFLFGGIGLVLGSTKDWWSGLVGILCGFVLLRDKLPFLNKFFGRASE